MLIVIINFYLLMVLAFFLSSSLVVEMFSSVVNILLGGIFIYRSFESPWYFYILSLSIVGGYMVLVCFNFMSLPNVSTHTIYRTKEVIVDFLVCGFFIILIMYFPTGDKVFTNDFTDFFLNMTEMSNIMVTFPFCYYLIFLLVLLLTLLLVIDVIISNSKGCVLLFKNN